YQPHTELYMKSMSGAEATGRGRGNCRNRFPTKPGQSGWGAEDISCSQPIQCLRLSRWGGGQSEFARDCTCSKIYCLDLELQRTVVSPHLSSTVVSPQVGQIINTLVPVEPYRQAMTNEQRDWSPSLTPVSIYAKNAPNFRRHLLPHHTTSSVVRTR